MHLPMARIQIVGVTCHLDAVLTTVQELGALQLDDATRECGALPKDDRVEAERETISYLLVRLESLLTALSIVPNGDGPWPLPGDPAAPREESIAELRAGLEALGSTVQAITDRRERLIAELQSLPRYEATIRRLLPLAAEIPQLNHYEVIALLIDRHYEHILPQIRAELTHLAQDHFEMVSGRVDDQTLGTLLVVPRQAMPEIMELLGHKQINQLRLPDELAGVPLRQTLSALLQRKEEIPQEIRRTDQELARLAEEWEIDLRRWWHLLQDRTALLRSHPLVGATRTTFVICGWIPRPALPELRRHLQAEVGEEVVVDEVGITPEMAQATPVLLHNPAMIRPFETLVSLLALPRYPGWDPSWLMAVFVPLFFGMILGDIAYGLVVMVLGIWLRRRFTGTVRDMGWVLLWGGGWSVLFGWIYGEFLGTLGESYGLHPILNRAEALVPLFITAVAVGAAQVTLGLLLGAWDALRQRHLRLLSEKIGALVSLMGLYALVATVTRLLPAQFFTPAMAAVLVGLVMLSAPMGLIGLLLGPLEFLGTIGNILSYLRIAAIGLSSVYLAEVANEMFGLLGNLLLGFVVAALFHVLNIALGIVSPTIQSLRLQYVEFFGKFFQGGGKPFRPLKRTSAPGWQG